MSGVDVEKEELKVAKVPAEMAFASLLLTRDSCNSFTFETVHIASYSETHWRAK